jgi:hypothetical protein
MDREPWPETKATGPHAAADAQDKGTGQGTDARTGAGRGPRPGASTGPGAGSGTGSSAGTGPGAGSGTGSSAGTGSSPRTGTGSGTGAGTGTDRNGARGKPAPARRAAYGGLASDPRLPIWIGRALASVVVGTAVSIWVGWRLGVTAAALIAIADIIFRSKTTARVPASARVTSAQRRSQRQLARLRMKGYVTLNARAIPGTRQVIDHLVIGPSGVYALDSERWDRRLPVRTAAGDQLYHGPFTQRDRLEHARWEAGKASRLIGAAAQRAIDVRPAMVIYGPTIPWTVVRLHGVDVFGGGRLRSYLRQQRKARQTPRLDDQQISLIQQAAERALPPVKQ